jgi:hypothetical protein
VRRAVTSAASYTLRDKKSPASGRRSGFIAPSETSIHRAETCIHRAAESNANGSMASAQAPRLTLLCNSAIFTRFAPDPGRTVARGK